MAADRVLVEVPPRAIADLNVLAWERLRCRLLRSGDTLVVSVADLGALLVHGSRSPERDLPRRWVQVLLGFGAAPDAIEAHNQSDIPGLATISLLLARVRPASDWDVPGAVAPLLGLAAALATDATRATSAPGTPISGALDRQASSCFGDQQAAPWTPYELSLELAEWTDPEGRPVAPDAGFFERVAPLRTRMSEAQIERQIRRLPTAATWDGWPPPSSVIELLLLATLYDGARRVSLDAVLTEGPRPYEALKQRLTCRALSLRNRVIQASDNPHDEPGLVNVILSRSRLEARRRAQAALHSLVSAMNQRSPAAQRSAAARGARR